MARKQSDYLASLLSGSAPEPAPAQGEAVPSAPAPVAPAAAATAAPTTVAPVAAASGRAGLSLLGRENALARIATGEVRQVTQLLLQPERVRIWPGNARLQAQLSEESCRELIDSIISEGGQKVPAIVRHLTNDPDHDYELIAGTRRHFAISWLRAHSYPDMKLLAQVADMDDEAAFRLADIENRARKDISDIERARNYAEAVDRHYGGRAVRMAERLKLSKGWLSKMLKAATIPDEVLGAFANLHELSLNPAYQLALALEDPSREPAILSQAEAIARENAQAVDAGSPALPGNVVAKRLLAARPVAQPSSPPARDLRLEVPGTHGRPILAVKAVNRQGVTLHLPMASGAGDDQLADALREVLRVLRLNGVSLS